MRNMISFIFLSLLLSLVLTACSGYNYEVIFGLGSDFFKAKKVGQDAFELPCTEAEFVSIKKRLDAHGFSGWDKFFYAANKHYSIDSRKDERRISAVYKFHNHEAVTAVAIYDPDRKILTLMLANDYGG